MTKELEQSLGKGPVYSYITVVGGSSSDISDISAELLLLLLLLTFYSSANNSIPLTPVSVLAFS